MLLDLKILGREKIPLVCFKEALGSDCYNLKLLVCSDHLVRKDKKEHDVIEHQQMETL